MNDSIDILLAKHFSGELKSHEEKAIRQWINEHPEEYAKLEKLIGKVEPTNFNLTVDADKAWTKVESQVGEYNQQRRRGQMRRLVYGVAASILFMAGLFSWLSLFPKEEVASYASTSVGKPSIQLPDESTVVLNRNSQISYKSSKGRPREVTLKGEAFFEVKPNPGRPFKIKTSTIEIVVVGTAFNVDAYSDRYSRVSVEHGKVKIGVANQSVLVSAGEEAIFENGVLKTEKIDDPNRFALKNGKLVFQNCSFERAVRFMERYYNQEILVEGDASHCYINTTFEKETIDEALKELQLYLGFNYKKSDGKIVISGLKCKSDETSHDR